MDTWIPWFFHPSAADTGGQGGEATKACTAQGSIDAISNFLQFGLLATQMIVLTVAFHCVAFLCLLLAGVTGVIHLARSAHIVAPLNLSHRMLLPGPLWMGILT